MKSRQLLPLTFILFTLLFLSCKILQPFKKQPAGPPPETAIIAEIEERLSDAAIQLLATDADITPRKYADRKKIFETVLDEYMQLTGFRKQITLKTRVDGRTIYLPLKILEVTPRATEILADTVTTIGVLQDEKFSGEIIDMAWNTETKNAPYQLQLLFADSLRIIQWPQDLAKAITYPFSPDDLKSVSPTIPLGTITSIENNTNSSNKILLSGSALVKSQVFNVSEGMFLQPDSSMDTTWEYSAANRFVSLKGKDSSGFFVQRELAGGLHKVALNKEGYLQLYENNNQLPIWQSDYPVGSRLFLLDEKTMAVCADNQRFFSAFSLQEKSLKYIGRSPRFEGPVRGVLLARFSEKKKSYLVAVLNHNRAGVPVSRLREVDGDNFRWDTTDLPDSAYFPRERESLTLVREGNRQISLASFYSIPPAVRYNVFETPIRLNRVGEPDKLLLESATFSDSHKSWTLVFRKNLRFSDGSPLTSTSVIRSWLINWRSDKRRAPSTAWLWEDIEGARAYNTQAAGSVSGLSIVDSQTVHIQLTAPRPDFLRHLAQPAFRVVKRGDKSAVGSGPYRITRIRNGQNTSMVVCERNPLYHLGQPMIKSVQFVYRGKQLPEVSLRGGETGVVVQERMNVDYFRQIDDTRMIPFPKKATYFLAMNPYKTASTASMNLRKSIGTTVLRKEILAGIITGGESWVTNHFFSAPYEPVAEPAVAIRDFPQEPLRIIYRSGDMVASQIAGRLSARLAQTGLAAKLPLALGENEFQTAITSSNYDILIDHCQPQFFSPAYDFLQLLQRGYAVPGMIKDTLMADLAGGPDNSYQAERVLIDQAILYPLVTVKTFAVLPEAIRGIRLYGTETLDCARAWLQ